MPPDDGIASADAGPSSDVQEALAKQEEHTQGATASRNGGRPSGTSSGGHTSATLSTAIRRRMHYVPAKMPVLIRLPNQRLKSVELHPGKSVSLGKFGTFMADDIIGLPFGLTFEITSKRAPDGAASTAHGDESNEEMSDKGDKDSVAAPAKIGKRKAKKLAKKGQGTRREEVGDVKIVLSGNVDELEDNSATNELINDFAQGPQQNAQTMTFLDIQALKQAGAEGRDIVLQEVASNSTFAQRTSWSQQKFVMRKEAKHMRLFTPVAPTLTNITRFFMERYERDANDKLRGLRADALSNILSLAGVAPGRRFLVVDGVGGLLTGAMLERMGGEGRVLVLNDADSPPALDLMAQFALPNNCVDPVLRSMHWACTEVDWQSSIDPAFESTDVTPAGRPATDRDRQRFRKRMAIHTGLERLRQEYFDGEFDGIIVASPYDAASVVRRVLPLLSGSANVVVHSPYLQALTEAQAVLRLSHSLVNVSVMEPFVRRYQVLPGRMHPEMMTSATGGFILHAIRVLTEEESVAKKREHEQGDMKTNGDEEEPAQILKKARIAL